MSGLLIVRSLALDLTDSADVTSLPGEALDGEVVLDGTRIG